MAYFFEQSRRHLEDSRVRRSDVGRRRRNHTHRVVLRHPGRFINAWPSAYLLLVHYDVSLCGGGADSCRSRLCLDQASHSPIFVQDPRPQITLLRHWWVPSFVYSLHFSDILQETCSSYPNARLVKPTSNGKAFMGTSFASRLSLEQVQSVTSITLKSNFMS